MSCASGIFALSGPDAAATVVGDCSATEVLVAMYVGALVRSKKEYALKTNIKNIESAVLFINLLLLCGISELLASKQLLLIHPYRSFSSGASGPDCLRLFLIL